jgi:AraC family transcriptional regulator
MNAVNSAVLSASMPAAMPAAIPGHTPHSASRVSLQTSARLGWQGFGADLIGIGAGVHRIPALKHHRVGIHVGAPVKAHCLCNERRHIRLQSHGDADVIPAGLDGQWSDESDCTIFSVWIDDALAQKTFERMELRANAAQIRPRFQMRDPRFQHLAWALRAELEADDASDPLYAESVCMAMIVRLIGAEPMLERKRTSTLAPRLAARVIEFIEGNLAQRLTLADLAALADLSVPHFKVLFRETLGMPVHQYVVQRRVERAHDLLLEGRLSTSQVALETGFAHQSHMAHWMNRLLGVTPRAVVRGRA